MSTVDAVSLFSILLAAVSLVAAWRISKAGHCRALKFAVPILLVAGLAVDVVVFLMAASAAATLSLSCGIRAWLLRSKSAEETLPPTDKPWIVRALRILGIVEVLIGIFATPIAFLSPLALDAGNSPSAFGFIVAIISFAVLLISAPVGSVKIAKAKGAKTALLYLLLPLIPLLASLAVPGMWWASAHHGQ